MSNFQHQTKKTIINVSLSAGSFAIEFHISGSVGTEKRHLILEIRTPHLYSGFEISTFCGETHVGVGERGAKIGVQNFLDNQLMTHAKIR